LLQSRSLKKNQKIELKVTIRKYFNKNLYTIHLTYKFIVTYKTNCYDSFIYLRWFAKLLFIVERKTLNGYWIKIIIAKEKSLKITSKKLLRLDLPLNLHTPHLRNRLILKMVAEKFWKLGQRTVSNNTIKLLRNHGSAASVSLNIRRAMWCLVLYSLYQSPNSTYPLDGIIVDVELPRDIKSMFVYATCYFKHW